MGAGAALFVLVVLPVVLYFVIRYAVYSGIRDAIGEQVDAIATDAQREG